MISEPTKRFTGLVDKYVKYRPTYPQEVITYLKNECNLSDDSFIADIGAGTGIFTALLLNQHYSVIAVEPNNDMRQAAVNQLSDNTNFTAIAGTAEATTLQDQSVDLVVCAQAFHWFNEAATQVEFKRILKADGKVALIWNNRDAESDEFAAAYEKLLKDKAIDYNKVNHRNIGELDFKAFFKNGDYKTKYFSNEQVFDLDGLLGRAFSSSYSPREDTEAGKKFKDLLQELFAKYNEDGTVKFKYRTEVYLGEV